MEAGFSTDGYIIDQDCFAAYPYRALTSDVNGCGWIAAYNLRHALGQAVWFDEVRVQMDALFPIRMPGPTTMRAMRAYLERHIPDYRLSFGRKAVLDMARQSHAGILRYWERREPHFVAYVLQPNGQHRFFNVADGLEDAVFDMEAFIRTHCRFGVVRAITVERTKQQTLFTR